MCVNLAIIWEPYLVGMGIDIGLPWEYMRMEYNGIIKHEPRSKLPAIDFSIRWNLFLEKLNGVTRAQAFHKLRASSCTRKLRASPKSHR